MRWGEGLSLDFAISVDEGLTQDIVRVEGELDLWSSPKLKKALSALRGRSPIRGVVCDFREVSFIDSATLGVLLEEVRRRPATRFSVLLSDPRLRRAFEITGLDRYVELSVAAEPAPA